MTERPKLGTLPSEDVQRLATLQAALSAVKEEIIEHEGGLGWGRSLPRVGLQCADTQSSRSLGPHERPTL